MATIIFPSGREVPTEPANGTDFQLDELKMIVGGYIEIVPTKDGKLMVINEEGKLKNLPYNKKATELADLPSPEDIRTLMAIDIPGVRIIGDPNQEDYIAGPALVCDLDQIR